MTERDRRLRFLIVGVARSGTTLIQRLASELDGVWVPPETHFWRHATTIAHRAEWPLTDAGIDEVLDSLPSLPGLADFAVEHATVRALLPESPWLWDLFEAILLAAAPPSARVIGEKTPAHHRWAHRLLGEIASLRVIAVRRDPYETFASHLDLPWGIKDPVEFAVRWKVADDELRAIAQAFPERVLVLDHHAVAAAPDEARTQIADLLGVDPTPRSSGDDLGRLFDPAETWKARAMAVIEPSARHRNDLTAEQAERVRIVTEGEVAPDLGAGVAAALATERRLAALSSLPLPLTVANGPTWYTSDSVRAREWERRAADLRATARRWEARAEELNSEKKVLDAEKTKISAEKKVLDAEKTKISAELAAVRSTAEELSRQLEALQRRRSVRAANAAGRLLRRGGRH